MAISQRSKPENSPSVFTGGAGNLFMYPSAFTGGVAGTNNNNNNNNNNNMLGVEEANPQNPAVMKLKGGSHHKRNASYDPAMMRKQF